MTASTATAIIDAERRAFLNTGMTKRGFTYGLIRGMRLGEVITQKTEQTLLVHFGLAAREKKPLQEFFIFKHGMLVAGPVSATSDRRALTAYAKAEGTARDYLHAKGYYAMPKPKS